MYKHHLYKVLQVRESATETMIHDGYMRRMKLLTETEHKTPEDDRQYMLDMAKINMAYEVLIDPAKRRVYDDSIIAKRTQREEKRRGESEENYDAINWRDKFHQLEDEHYKLSDTFEMREELLLFLSTNHLRPDIMKKAVEIESEIEIQKVYSIIDKPAPEQKQETFLDYIRSRDWSKVDFFALVLLIFLMVKGFFSFF